MKMIKKVTSILLSLSIMSAFGCGINVAAEDEISVELDGKQIAFDVEPQIIDGRTMVPLRKIFEEIGALVKWDEETQTVSARKSSKTVTLSIGSEELNIDRGDTDDEGNPISETVKLDVPAQIVSGRTLVPARAISESFGLDVDWDGENKRVIITSGEDDDDSWKENVGSVDLSEFTYTGNGIEISDNQISITAGGDFTLTGNLENGNITVSTDEKVKLRLNSVSITAENEPCIFVENADKAYITITEGTENKFVAANSEKGAIYSKDNLEIKGKGTLNIISSSGNGIKASDNLKIENGTINIEAASDGIHVNDTFKMTGGSLNITADGDGIDSESIVSISGGNINIETNGVPVEYSNITNTEQNTPKRGFSEENADVEFEKSSKGVNAEWMLYVSGGEITINSASHAIHCQDEIQIDGGNFSLGSKYEKGISAHGNLTVNGDDTSIDITKSTEGMESKNIMTVNAGTIKIVATDDAVNATGGNSGSMEMPRGNFGMLTEFENRTRFEKNPPERQNDGGNINEKPQPPENEQPGMDKTPIEFSDDGKNPSVLPNIETDRALPNAENDNRRHEEKMPPMNGNETMQGQNRGGNLKDCLVINGGYLELYAEDDCLDSNGNLIINGGTIKASNPNGSFSGAFAVIDPDGQTTISEKATLIFAAGSGDEKSLKLSQNTIIVYCENSHDGEKITVSDKDGNVIYDYTPIGRFSAILISSEELTLGEAYTVEIGEEKYEAVLSEKSTVIGTKKGGNKGFEGRQTMR